MGKFQKGHIPWNKDKKDLYKHTQEWKSETSKIMKGLYLAGNYAGGFKKGNIGYWEGRNRSEDTKQKLSIAHKKLNRREFFKKIGLKGLLKQQNMKQPTSIEKTLYDYLFLKGILFEKQKLINGKFIVDAYIPSLNLVIEADGNYWHTLDTIQKKDKAENAYLSKCGFGVIRLSEEEIKSGKFKERMVL